MAIVEREVLKGEQPSVPETQPEPSRERLPLGPIKTIHVYWLAGYELRRLHDLRGRRDEPGHRGAPRRGRSLRCQRSSSITPSSRLRPGQSS